MELYNIVEQIENLENFRDTKCPKCFVNLKIQKLDIYADCPNCQTHHKIRGFSAVTEIEEIVVTSLMWILNHEMSDEIIEKYRQIAKVELE